MDLVKELMSLFHGLEKAHGKYVISADVTAGKKLVGQARTVREPVTEDLWKQHLSGIEGLGIVPIMDDNTCRFGAIDVDTYEGLDVKKILADVQKHALPIVPCRSKSGGIHFFMFIRENVPAIELKKKLTSFAELLGFRGCEIFPKQDVVLADRGDIGGWINMPYFDEQNTTRYGYKPDGATMSLKEFIHEARRVSLSLSEFNLFSVNSISDISDGPPCLQKLAGKTFTEGTRNNCLINIAIYLKKSKPNDWETVIGDYNVRYFDPPLSEREVNSIIESVRRKEYRYFCNRSPMKDNCDATTCRTRPFGVGESAKMPGLKGLVKYDTNPPIWFLTVEGLGRLELCTDDIQQQVKFQKRCMDALNFAPPTINHTKWMQIVNDLFDGMTVIDAPKESSPEGLLMNHLEQFCTSHIVAKNKEEILLGRPWKDKDTYYFRMMDFLDYLERKKFRDFKSNKVSALFYEKGFVYISEEIKGKTARLWVTNSIKEQTESFTPPEVKGENVF